MNKYELNGKIIETTEERYERDFKPIGYVPVKEKPEPKSETKKETKKIEVE